MRNRVLLLAAVPALLVAGCSFGKTIDADKAESEIGKGFEQQVSGAKVKSLSCPDDVDAEKGQKASCNIALEDGRKGKVNFTVLNDDGDIRWSADGVK